MTFSQADLGNALNQCAEYAADLPWDAPDLLFALVPTSLIAQQAPTLVSPDDFSALSPVLQDPEDDNATTAEWLSTVAWPDAVEGCALVTTITVVPPDDPGSEGRTARLIAGVLRTGSKVALLAVKDDDGLRTHPDLAPDLLEALAATFS